MSPVPTSEELMKRVIACIVAASLAIGACAPRRRQDASDGGATSRRDAPEHCSAVPSADTLRRLLAVAPDSNEAGGLFHGRAEWAATVNRAAAVCAVAAPNDSVGGHWPGSRNIARAKAFTANGFSTDTLAFSTARLYTLTQPGHSLWGIAQPEPFSPACLSPGDEEDQCGGATAFGGGVPLYREGRIVGGLGVSGDTPCAGHEIAKRVRHLAGLDPRAGMLVDDITYSSTDRPTIYTHPLCPNAWRNGRKIGEETSAVGY
jgi:uncharacterized protein GlcG (DUF336 family)